MTGTLTLNGATVQLTHVYAHAEPGFFDKKTEDIHVLFSDVPLTDEQRADDFALIHLVRDGKARIVEIVIDAKGQPISGSLYAREFDGTASAAGMHKFTRERLERKVIAGRLWTDSPHEFMHVTWQYDVHFTAPIPRPPTAAERAAALTSPPGRAATAHLAAIRQARLAAFVATLTSASAADYRGSDAATRLQQLRDDMPADSRVVDLVAQTDGSVLAKVEGHEGVVVIGHTLRMVQEGGVWKVSYRK